VQLKNNSFVRPFQIVMGLLGLPKYGTFDPTWIISLFFPLFFGIIIADVGYGLLFLWFGLWLLGKARRGEGWDLSFMGAYVP
ncbi:V-type ATPase 116kDa subunit family protein, partial [Staphylococcus aureus]|nr:V-type ATPase 116kDa subunit family protein [Staphylococcus aureus]